MKQVKRKIPFYAPDIDESERAQIEDVLSFEESKKTEELEQKFANYVGASYAISTSNGTSALHLSMCAIDLKRGDKVVCSVNAHPSVPEVVRHFDAEPVFVDISADDYNIDLDKLEMLLEDQNSKKLKAVIINHLGGATVNLERVYNIAEIFNVKIIEDASEAMGTTYGGEKIGSTGASITTFSFNPHLKGSISNGGMLVTEDFDLYERALMLRNHGMELEESDSQQLDYIYDVIDIGCKYDIGELAAAYSLARLNKCDSNLQERRKIATQYIERLKDLPHIGLPNISSEHSFHLFIITIDTNRDAFAKELHERGIGSGLHYIPLHLLTYYKNKYNLRVNDFPVALAQYQKVLSIPVYAGMSSSDIDYVCDQIIDIATSRR